MPDYRLYLLDRQGRIRHAPVLLECENDEHAMRIAEERRDGRGAELWCGARKLKTFAYDDVGIVEKKD